MSWPQTMELFQSDDELVPTAPAREPLAPGAVLLRRLAEPDAVALLADLQAVLERAPLRHMVTPGGFRMSVAISNCGALGWVSNPGMRRATALSGTPVGRIFGAQVGCAYSPQLWASGMRRPSLRTIQGNAGERTFEV